MSGEVEAEKRTQLSEWREEQFQMLLNDQQRARAELDRALLQAVRTHSVTLSSPLFRYQCPLSFQKEQEDEAIATDHLRKERVRQFQEAKRREVEWAEELSAIAQVEQQQISKGREKVRFFFFSEA